MTRFVIDASVAIKWVVEEAGTEQALTLRRHTLAAPDLIVAECADILWKKVRLGQMTAREADLAARLLTRADIELHPMRTLMADALGHALALDHPAYDGVYLSLALSTGDRFVSADERFVRKVREHGDEAVRDAVLLLAEVA